MKNREYVITEIKNNSAINGPINKANGKIAIPYIKKKFDKLVS